MNYIVPLIAAIVALISIQRYFLARERFKLDLFEKRFATFKAIEAFIDTVISDRRVSSESLQKFDRDTQTAFFLFDQDIVQFINEIRTKANTAHYLREEQKDYEPATPERMELGQKKIKILEELIDEQTKLKYRFSKYLKFRNWKYGFMAGISN